MISVAFDRSSLTLATLTVTEDFTATYWISNEVEWPRFSRRKTTAPPSPYLNGRTLLAKVADMGTLPLTVYAQGATTSALETAKTALQTCVDQWTYDLTLTVDGVARAYVAECVDDDISWGPIDAPLVRAHFARGSFVIPLYPA